MSSSSVSSGNRNPNGTMTFYDAMKPDFDPVILRRKRLANVREMMQEHDLGAVLLLDPYNQRYATGSRNMFGYFLRNSTRYIYIPLMGPVILFEYPGSSHISTWLETIDEARLSKIVFASVNGRDRAASKPFAQEISDLMRQHCGRHRRVGMDRCFHSLALALEAEELIVEDCMQFLLNTRRLKTPEEIACLSLSMSAVEAAICGVESDLRPGVSENELFARMYHGVLMNGGEFIETRLLSSGPKTNPWFNEAGERRLRPGELLALDTDTIGVNGYYADISRTFFCGPGKPSGYQKSLYRMAWEQIHHNASILKPGMSFKEITECAWKIPERFFDLRYPSIIHGVGMHGEKPIVAHAADLDRFTGEGILEAGMVVSVESYIGEAGGSEGVKLEDQFAITEDGIVPMSNYPFDERLLEREI